MKKRKRKSELEVEQYQTLEPVNPGQRECLRCGAMFKEVLYHG